MSLLLYAILDSDPAAVTGSGLGGRPLRTVSGSGLTAVVADSPGPVEPDEQTLRDYERAVETLMDRATLLPARFGSMVADEKAVGRLLEERRRELLQAAAKVRGAVELGVSAHWEQRPHRPTGPTAGTEYMLGRLDLARRGQELAADIDRALGGLSRERLRRTPRRPDGPVRASYLVDRDQVPSFMEQARTLDRSIVDARIICTGPWPPYSFVSEEVR